MKLKLLTIAAACLALASCGRQPQVFELKADNGMSVKITDFGGRIMAINVPDKDGITRDVVLGFDDPEQYFKCNNETDFGAAIGRYANRLNQGKITLDGKEYQLPQNNFGHCLHGGPEGWQYQYYDVVEADSKHVVLKMESPDGDNNFPGNVTAYVTYTLSCCGKLKIDYEATTDATTVINMTNHSYFNLGGDPTKTILEDCLFINASNYTPVDDTYMTTGEIAPVEGTPMDFKNGIHTVGERIGQTDFEQIANGNGYDHNWVLDTKGNIQIPAAALYNAESGICLTVFTTEPGIQVYSGNFLDGSVTGKNGIKYAQRTGICLETQKYPDTPNKPEWPSATLRPGEKYESHTIFAFQSAGLGHSDKCGACCGEQKHEGCHEGGCDKGHDCCSNH